jgi:hypothetical protein
MIPTMPDVINFNGSVWGATTKGTPFVEMLRQGNHIEGRLCMMEPGLGRESFPKPGPSSRAHSQQLLEHTYSSNSFRGHRCTLY